MVTVDIGISMPEAELRSAIEDAWHDSARTTADRLIAALRTRAAGQAARYLHGHWSHLFDVGGRPTERQCRVAFDRVENRVVAMQVMASFKWRDSTQVERDDVTDSLVNANPEALTDPEQWELERSADLPGWAS